MNEKFITISIILFLLYFIYIFIICIERAEKKLKRKEFIIYFFIPFSKWLYGFLKLFRKDD